MSNGLCPECGTNGEVVNDENIVEEGKEYSETIFGCCECGHSWTEKKERNKK